ncbi:MAG: hypothetical protein JHC93_00965 [Parachlamydiales bacterium]|nr:hypothetical protein [Parachlamydiales bacterium]
MDEEQYYLGDELDKEILKHRECHFGGHFPTMIDYYELEGLGVDEELTIDRIHYLAKVEEELGYNLAAEMLLGAEMEEIARSRMAYKQLRAVYENDLIPPQLLADLILSENEDPQEEIDAIVEQGEIMISPLRNLLVADAFYSPLFPGYGLAPGRAAICLGRLGDKDSIIPLFESLGKSNFLIDDAILIALGQLKPYSTEFLLRVLRSRPITEDNERSAMALAAISNDDAESATMALLELKSFDMSVYKRIAAYLIPLCHSLSDPKDRQDFLELAKNSPAVLADEFKLIEKLWKKPSAKSS